MQKFANGCAGTQYHDSQKNALYGPEILQKKLFSSRNFTCVINPGGFEDAPAVGNKTRERYKLEYHSEESSKRRHPSKRSESGIINFSKIISTDVNA